MHSEAAFEATEVAQFDETISDGEFLISFMCLPLENLDFCFPEFTELLD
jgi:hypothetical protein